MCRPIYKLSKCGLAVGLLSARDNCNTDEMFVGNWYPGFFQWFASRFTVFDKY